MSYSQDPANFDPEFRAALRKYVEEIWWPVVKRDPTQYDYWRSRPEIRMGRFKIVRSEGQDVLAE